jgi:hypothetical protein
MSNGQGAIANAQEESVAVLSRMVDALYQDTELDYIASRQCSPPRAVRDYVRILRNECHPELIRRLFPEGYLFMEDFHWIRFPWPHAYVFKYRNDFFFHYHAQGSDVQFTIRSLEYERLVVRALHTLIALHLGSSGRVLDKLQVVVCRKCTDHCRSCPFEDSFAEPGVMGAKQAETIAAFLNRNSEIEQLQFVGNGEPFLNYPVMVNLMRESKYVKTISIYTNGFWGRQAGTFLRELSGANSAAEVIINLGMDFRHPPPTQRGAEAVLHHFLELSAKGELTNVRLHLRGIFVNKQLVSSDPIMSMLDKQGLPSDRLEQIVGRLLEGQKVEYPDTQGSVLVSYNRLRTSPDAEADPERLTEWPLCLVATDKIALALGMYDAAVAIAEYDDCLNSRQAYEIAQSNILLRDMPPPVLSKTVQMLARAFPEILLPRYLPTDILRNIYKEPYTALIFTMLLFTEICRNKVGRTAALESVLEEVGIAPGDNLRELDTWAEALLQPTMPGVVCRRQNWWARQTDGAVESDRRLNRWLPYWELEDQERACRIRDTFAIEPILEGIRHFLVEKYLWEHNSNPVTSLTLTGSLVYSYSSACPVTDIDLIATVKLPRITNICHLSDNTTVWVVSKENLQGNSVEALHIDFAINIEHGLILFGPNPIRYPAPIIERAKMAYFYANLIQRILFDRSLRDIFKRMVELRRILKQISQLLDEEPERLHRHQILAEADLRQFTCIRRAFRAIFGQYEFDQRGAWQKFDELIRSGEASHQRTRLIALVVQATLLKAKLLRFIQHLSELSPPNDLPQESRYHVYAVFNSLRHDSPLELHLDFLERFQNDLSILVNLAEHSPYKKVHTRISRQIRTMSTSQPFSVREREMIRTALSRNRHVLTNPE